MTDTHNPRCPCGFPRSACWRCSNPDTQPDDGGASDACTSAAAQDVCVCGAGCDPNACPADECWVKMGEPTVLEPLLPDETPLQAAERLGVIVLEPRSTYDRALVGITTAPKDDWDRKTATPCAVYDTLKCIMATMEVDGMEFDEAVEWFDFNTSSAWVGEGTPTFVELLAVVEP